MRSQAGQDLRPCHKVPIHANVTPARNEYNEQERKEGLTKTVYPADLHNTQNILSVDGSSPYDFKIACRRCQYIMEKRRNLLGESSFNLNGICEHCLNKIPRAFCLNKMIVKRLFPNKSLLKNMGMQINRSRWHSTNNNTDIKGYLPDRLKLSDSFNSNIIWRIPLRPDHSRLFYPVNSTSNIGTFDGDIITKNKDHLFYSKSLGNIITKIGSISTKADVTKNYTSSTRKVYRDSKSHQLGANLKKSPSQANVLKYKNVDFVNKFKKTLIALNNETATTDFNLHKPLSGQNSDSEEGFYCSLSDIVKDYARKDFEYYFPKKTVKDFKTIIIQKRSSELLKNTQDINSTDKKEKLKLYVSLPEEKSQSATKVGRSTDKSMEVINKKQRYDKKSNLDNTLTEKSKLHMQQRNLNQTHTQNPKEVKDRVRKTSIKETTKNDSKEREMKDTVGSKEVDKSQHILKNSKMMQDMNKPKHESKHTEQTTKENRNKSKGMENKLNEKKNNQEKSTKRDIDINATAILRSSIENNKPNKIKKTKSPSKINHKNLLNGELEKLYEKQTLPRKDKELKTLDAGREKNFTLPEPTAKTLVKNVLDKKTDSLKKSRSEEKHKVAKDIIEDISFTKIKVRNPSADDLLRKLVKLKQTTPRIRREISDIKIKGIILKHRGHKFKKQEDCIVCTDSNVALELESLDLANKNEMDVKITDMIIGAKIIKNKLSHIKKNTEDSTSPILFQSIYKDDLINEAHKIHNPGPRSTFHVEPISKEPTLKTKEIKTAEQEVPKGIIRYALSDRTFIDKGWTLLPTEKVVRKMNVYRMRPAHPEFDWFEHNKSKCLMQYDSGEKLAEFNDSGRGRWFYKNGRVALDYYDAEETNAQQRFVVYSSGEPDERGRSRPFTILATFDYLGNGIVFDHVGKIRLKYNQTEGVVLDRSIGPVSHWKWHTLNDPPVLQQVMIDTQMPHKDPDILKLGKPEDVKHRTDNEAMLAIEFDNFIKEKSKKLTQSFKPFQIKMKALKINEQFSLKVLDQATVYLIFRDGSANLKLNLGMVLDHKEIVDTDTAEVGEVSSSVERLPARTDSIAGLQSGLARAQHMAKLRADRENRLRPTQPISSVDRLAAPLSRPMRTPLRTATSASTTPVCSRKPSSNNLYCENRPF